MFFIRTASLGFAAILVGSAFALPLNLAPVDANDLVARSQGELQGRALGALSDDELFLRHTRREMRHFYRRMDDPDHNPAVHRVVDHVSGAFDDARSIEEGHKKVLALAKQKGVTPSQKHETHITRLAEFGDKMKELRPVIKEYHDADPAVANTDIVRVAHQVTTMKKTMQRSKSFAEKKIKQYDRLPDAHK